MIVVDTNSIVYLYISTVYSHDAETLYQRDNHWCAPLLWRSEFRNVLSVLIRKERITLEEAYHIYYEACRIVAGNEYQPDPVEVLRLASESGCSAYDCEFVHLAKYLRTYLITMDRKLLSLFPNRAKKLVDY